MSGKSVDLGVQLTYGEKPADLAVRARARLSREVQEASGSRPAWPPIPPRYAADDCVGVAGYYLRCD